jgi:hypothetical protein
VTAPAPNLVLPAIERQATRDYPCPTCGASVGVRCRIVTRGSVGPGYPVKTKVDVRQKPCSERVALAIRDFDVGGAPAT